MKTIKFIAIFAVLLTCLCTAAFSKTKPIQKFTVRFEHVAFNIPDPVAAAKWYHENLGMKIMRSGGAPTFTTFIAGSGENMMMELFHNADFPLLNPATIHHMAIHFAFVTPNIEATIAKLTAAGATIADSLKKTASGDKVVTLRDPWGIPIQFAQRVTPMLAFAGLYPEHFAMNVADSRAKAKWYAENLGFLIIKEGKAPSYGMFISDPDKNMMFELYQQASYPVLNFDSLSYNALHVALMVDDIAAAKDALVKAGAKVAVDLTTTPAGDQVLMLRDPWGQPLQIVKRAAPMLK
jgi:uncharacterized glyoxalase superfamily protein PhnB